MRVPWRRRMLRATRSIRAGFGGAHRTIPLRMVVRAASQLEVLHRRLAADRVGLSVVQLQERTRVASTARRAREGAATAIANPDRAADAGGDVA